MNLSCPVTDRSLAGPRPALLDWDSTARRLPWSVIFMLGGGFALAHSCKESGLSEWIGDHFSMFGTFPVWLMVILICILVTMFSEFTSNSATATIFLPILAELVSVTSQMNTNFYHQYILRVLCSHLHFVVGQKSWGKSVVFNDSCRHIYLICIYVASSNASKRYRLLSGKIKNQRHGEI